MNKTAIITLIIGLVLGAGGALGISALTKANDDQPKTTSPTDHSAMSMNDMTTELQGLTGDDFDKAFIEMMIAHHEGAVEMAQLIPTRAKHGEIHTLGEAIITAQTQEISDMKQWQIDWGYTSNETMQMMHNSH